MSTLSSMALWMATQMASFATSKGFKWLTEMEAAPGEGEGEDDADDPAAAIALLNRNIEDMKAKMVLVQRLLDEKANAPEVVETLLPGK